MIFPNGLRHRGARCASGPTLPRIVIGARSGTPVRPGLRCGTGRARRRMKKRPELREGVIYVDKIRFTKSHSALRHRSLASAWVLRTTQGEPRQKQPTFRP